MTVWTRLEEVIMLGLVSNLNGNVHINQRIVHQNQVLNHDIQGKKAKILNFKTFLARKPCKRGKMERREERAGWEKPCELIRSNLGVTRTKRAAHPSHEQF